ncbi:putative chromatin remodeling & transcriptional activation HMG family [Rosa chinensis]|uniref:Putative chromatin remodeling & transcriptional activation HMG family n=1 Tax=Rosa chinensis TaxID=74649 RepID=A0A2P6SLN7_ROSCH|nr:uncharacterized protein LOC112182103 isoform X1 [Rosa chinensis]PRQ59579.1 putative chromatin remodeling & transcriptional activation HMG family [Rosa chinensis]
MVNLRRTRKRVRAIPRAPDGSAFQNCNKCGVSVPIALAVMHECEPNKEMKRFKGVGYDVEEKQSFWDQLVVMAPFHFFMKEFTKTREGGDWVETNRDGFEVWKKMSEKERQPYVKEAQRIDEAYQKALLEESNDGLKVDDEADSANTAGNNGKFGELYEDSDNESSDFLGESWDNSVRTGSWHTYHRPMVHQFTP